MIVIVNLHKDCCTHFCGRSSSYKNQGLDFSVLGNPFIIKPNGNYTLKQSLNLYYDYLNNTNDSLILEALKDIKSRHLNGEVVKLGCFCKNPKKCHCLIIKDYIEAEILIEYIYQ